MNASPASSEWGAFAVATLVLLVVLVASFMAIQLYRLRKPVPGCDAAFPPGRWPPAETFLGRFFYSPACDTGYASTRTACRGVTAGAMPSIEVGGDRGDGLCSGLLGVPP